MGYSASRWFLPPSAYLRELCRHELGVTPHVPLGGLDLAGEQLEKSRLACHPSSRVVMEAATRRVPRLQPYPVCSREGRLAGAVGSNDGDT